MLGGNAVLLLRVVYVDVVDQLCHHALGDFRCVGVAPDRCKERVNVHPLMVAQTDIPVNASGEILSRGISPK